jgi:hypothetical protein
MNPHLEKRKEMIPIKITKKDVLVAIITSPVWLILVALACVFMAVMMPLHWLGCAYQWCEDQQGRRR